MTFILAKLFWFLVAPLNLLTLLVVLGAGLSFAGRPRTARVSMSVAAALMVAVVVLPVDVWLARPLENRFPSTPLPERIDGVAVLGGAIDAGLSQENGEPAIGEAAERLVAFVEIMRDHPEARGLATGGDGALFPKGGKEDEPTRAVFRSIGFDDSRVVYENESRDTWENAVFGRRLVDPLPGETWVLVTSAAHMPRALGVFRRLGWEMIPHPVDRRVPHVSGAGRSPPDAAKSWARLGDASREWAGLIAYRLLGRTDTFFPAP